MKLILFSDIHANEPALNRLFQNLDDEHYDACYCLGDLVGNNIRPNECVEMIRKAHIQVLAGNHDVKAAITQSEKLYDSDPDGYGLINEANKAYLALLPRHIRLTYRKEQATADILMAHGSPRKIDEHVFEDASDDFLLQMLKESDARVLCVAHTHKPFFRTVRGDSGQDFYVINTGSVGKPKDGDIRGSYIRLIVHSNFPDIDGISVEIVRFHYDVESVARAIEASHLSSELAHDLRNGR